MKRIILLLVFISFHLFCFSQVQIVPQLFTQQYITNAAYSNSQKIIATAEYRVSRIEFMDGRTKLKMGSLATEGPVISLAADPIGTYFVAGTERGIIYIIKAATMELVKKIDAGVKMGNGNYAGYYVILNYFPLLFIDNSTFYFTGHVADKDEEAVKVSEYFVYQYNIANDVLKKTGKSGSNKPYCFLYDKPGRTISVLGEKKLTVINTISGLVKSEIATDKLGLSSFGTEYFFLDDSPNKRFGILSGSDNILFFYSMAEAKKIDSVKDVSRFLKLDGDNLLYQSPDRKFYIANFKTKQKKVVTTDSIQNQQWCSVILDFGQKVYGLITRNGIGTVNLNVSSVMLPDIKGDPLPWGVSITDKSTMLYATDKTLYEFDYLHAGFKREVAIFPDKIRKSIFIPSKQIVILNTSVSNMYGRFISDSVLAIDYVSGKTIWRYNVSAGGLNELKVNYDSSKLLLLTGKSTLTELDISTGEKINELNTRKTIHSADFKGELDGFYTGLIQQDRGYCLEFIGKNIKQFYYACFEYNSPVRVFACDNTKSYAAVAYPEDSRFFVFPLNKDSTHKEVKDNARVLAFSPDNNWLAGGTFGEGYVRLYSFPSLTKYLDIKCGVGKVYDLVFSPDSKFLFAMLEDGYISVINIAEKKVVTEMILYENNFLVKDTEGHYTANKSQVNGIGLRYGSRCYPVSNADIKYNRPDIIIRKMGVTDTAILNAYEKAYKKRLKRMKTDSKQLDNITGFPEAVIRNSQLIPPKTKESTIQLPVSISSASSGLQSFNIRINDVPIFGMRGVDIATRKIKKLDTTISIALTSGENRIDVECTDLNGIKSTREEIAVNCSKLMPVKTYFIGIGINRFRDAKNNLSWSVKDIRGLVQNFKKKDQDIVIVDTLFNEQVTAEKIKKLKDRLTKTDVNDKVIIAYSGHGLLSKEYDYYLSTYAVNFEKPEENGLLYEEFESLMDGIPARKKLLLIDACHSGEVDKDERIAMNRIADSLGLTKGIIIEDDSTTVQQVGLQNSFELMKTLFVNMGNSTGATIISAAAGNQFALERDDLKYGVFTYSIIEAMKQHSEMKINELKKIVGEKVEQLTNGMQKPTSRSEAVSADWNLW